MSAKEEVANIEAHIKALLPESYLESIGANVDAPNHKRELHHRCMRIFSDLSDRLAWADALRRGTCGTCRWVKTSPAQFGIPALYMCGNKKAPAFVASEVDPDDGCIKGFAPTEPTR